MNDDDMISVPYARHIVINRLEWVLGHRMSEVDKLFELAGVEKSKCWDDCTTCTRTSCDKNISYIKSDYPPFTADKQLELIKWLSRRYIEISNYDAENGRMYNIKPTVGDFATSFNYDFSECIAGLINNLWQDLTKEEKQQVKGILE